MLYSITIKVNITLCNRADISTAGTLTPTSVKLWVDYIYLDTDERRRFAQQSHEYLIEQLQFQQTSGSNAELNFNHPVKELIWTGQPQQLQALQQVERTPALTGAAADTFLLKLNGHDRFPQDIEITLPELRFISTVDLVV